MSPYHTLPISVQEYYHIQISFIIPWTAIIHVSIGTISGKFTIICKIMTPKIVQGPNLKKGYPSLPLGSKNISLNSFSNTLNYNQTIKFLGKIRWISTLQCTKNLCFVPKFHKSPYHGWDKNPPIPSPLASNTLLNNKKRVPPPPCTAIIVHFSQKMMLI